MVFELVDKSGEATQRLRAGPLPRINRPPAVVLIFMRAHMVQAKLPERFEPCQNLGQHLEQNEQQRDHCGEAEAVVGEGPQGVMDQKLQQKLYSQVADHGGREYPG